MKQVTGQLWQKNSLASTDYDVKLDATEFGPEAIDADTRIIERTGTGNWFLDGRPCCSNRVGVSAEQV